MALPVKSPPFAYSAAEWEAMPADQKGLLYMAQECDFYGTAEEPPGSNKGPRVSEILRIAHSTPGQPWCAAVVYVCYIHLAKCSARRPLYPASVASWIQWAKAYGKIRKTPKRGYLFFLCGEGRSHIGAVVRVRGDIVETLEGNTNDAGQREGVRMARRERRISSIDGYIDMSA